MVTSLKKLFSAAIRSSFPLVLSMSPAEGLEEGAAEAIITRSSGNFGDFQCNNAMKFAKVLKSLQGYTGPRSPKDIATAIVACLPPSEIVEECTVAVCLSLPSTFSLPLSSVAALYLAKWIYQYSSLCLSTPLHSCHSRERWSSPPFHAQAESVG
jgi:hypothetical protein